MIDVADLEGDGVLWADEVQLLDDAGHEHPGVLGGAAGMGASEIHDAAIVGTRDDALAELTIDVVGHGGAQVIVRVGCVHADQGEPMRSQGHQVRSQRH